MRMKKIILTVIFICVFATHNIFAQADEKEQEYDITVSANYLFSNINFSFKCIEAGSILTWRDLGLHGVEINVEINKESSKQKNIGFSFSRSFTGHHVDDDSTNSYDGIAVGSPKALLLNLSFEVVNEYKDSLFDIILGVDLNYLKLEDYDFKIYFADDTAIYLEDLGNKYDFYKLCLYGGVEKKFNYKKVYMSLFGQSGIGLYLGLADWIHRTDMDHPVSFSDIGILFRGSTGFDLGFNFSKNCTFFCNAKILYEISPSLSIHILRASNGDAASQFIMIEYFNASLGTGVKIKF